MTETQEDSWDLSSQDIYSISEDVLSATNITSLNLCFNILQEIPSSFCSNLTSLTCLKLDGNDIVALPSNIGELRNLQQLFISENYLCELPRSIGKLKHLRIFHASGNTLTYLPDEFKELTKLEEISIYENKLKSLPEGFSSFKELISFDVSNNYLQFLPQDFGSLEKLTNLNLCNNDMRALPKSFCKLSSLVLVDLSNNKLTSLPDALLSARIIRTFCASLNEIVELPQWFAEMEQIELLELEGNLLAESPFPDNFGCACPPLSSLKLAGNVMKKLPEYFGHLASLKLLHLGSILEEPERRRNLKNGNFLTRLPQSFGNLKCITHLHLDENYICELPEHFGNLLNLSYLALNNNALTSLPESFSNLISLKMCILSLNYIESLPDNFGNLTSLDELRLDGNMLSCLPTSFKNLRQLQILDLYCNRLTEVPEFIPSFKRLKILSLRENNINLPISAIPEMYPEPKYSAEYKKKLEDYFRRQLSKVNSNEMHASRTKSRSFNQNCVIKETWDCEDISDDKNTCESWPDSSILPCASFNDIHTQRIIPPRCNFSVKPGQFQDNLDSEVLDIIDTASLNATNKATLTLISEFDNTYVEKVGHSLDDNIIIPGQFEDADLTFLDHFKDKCSNAELNFDTKQRYNGS